VVIQKEQVVLNVGAAPTESLSNGNLDFPDKQVIKKIMIFNTIWSSIADGDMLRAMNTE